MGSDNKKIYKIVEKGIFEFYKVFKHNPHIFIKERDIQYYLYYLILKNLPNKGRVKLPQTDSDHKKIGRKISTCRIHAENAVYLRRIIKKKNKKG